MLRNSILLLLSVYLIGCSTSKQISKSAREKVLDNTALKTAHVGISIYDPESNKYLYNFQGDKYFVPASNTKIPTCYAAMKYLGDSLVGLKINYDKGWNYIKGTGDPTFLHPDFKTQPVYEFLKNATKDMYFVTTQDEFEKLGNGWSWNDYSASYMAERSIFPIYGNLFRFNYKNDTLYSVPTYPLDEIEIVGTAINSVTISIKDGIQLKSNFSNFYLERELNSNKIFAIPFARVYSGQELPIHTDSRTITRYLKDTIKNKHLLGGLEGTGQAFYSTKENFDPRNWYDSITDNKKFVNIHSQPTDSLLKPMMHRSDNFFAEQSLLMVSNEYLGVMNDARIIDTLLKTDFKDLAQKPRWVDGSGLSRYNLFTPQDFIAILNKMKNEFGMKRVQEILATGNEGTLTNYYLADSSFIYAKTGTLSGVVAISGFLYTKKKKLLIFSVLVNNHQASATQVRRAVESFIHGIRQNH